MMGFFPPLYDDELIYSWLARYMVYSGYTAISDAYIDIYGRKTISPSILFINNMTPEAVSVLSAYKQVRQLILHHTMFPEYARFIDPQKRERLLDEGDLTKGNWSYKVMLPVTDKGMRLRYCPECIKEDRERYGETYWHRVHQISNIRICTKHKSYLKDSTVEIKWGNTRLKNAEIIPHDDTSQMCDDNIIQSLAAYMEDVFYSDSYGNDKVGQFLNNNLDKTLKYSNGDRKLNALYDRYRDFYASLGESLMTIDYMSKLLRGCKGAYYYICQMGLFEGIEAVDLLESPMPDDKRIFRIVAEKLGEPLESVERIGSAVLYEYKSSEDNMSRKVRYEKKLEADDIRLLPEVKKIIAEIYGYGDNRPRKVTVKAVSRALGIDFHKLKKMKSCINEIERYYETQEQYWAREIIWAIEQIQMNNEPMNYKHIRNYVNLRKDNIKDCIDELKRQHEEIYEIVCTVI